MEYLLHHIGIAVKNITKSYKYYEAAFGYKNECEVYCQDENLHAMFIKNRNWERIELIEKIDENRASPIDSILKCRGGGIYHHCYEVNNLTEVCHELRTQGFLTLKRAEYAAQGFKCIYLIAPDNQLIELLQYQHD